MSNERASLEAQAQALVELETRAKEFPLFFYQYASDSAESFHRSRSRTRILSGGNRSGKTEAQVAELGAFGLGYRPWVLREMGLPPPENPWIRPEGLPPEALCYNGLGIRVPVPNNIFCVTGQSLKKGIGETIWPKFLKLLGPFIKDTHMSHAGVPYDCILKNGSRYVFGSAEQSAQAFEATNYTANGIDEPIPRRIYTGILRGAIDQYAPVMLTFTPVGAWSGWMFKDLYVPSLRPENKGRIESWTVSIFQNRFLPREAVEAFANDPAISEIEKQARLYGKFIHLTDVVYSVFNDQIHVIAPPFIPRDLYVGMAVDPHTIRPWAIIYFAVAPNGDVIIFREWPKADFTKIRRDPRSIEQYAMLIRQLDGDYQVSTRLIDPNYGPRKDRIRGIEVPSIVTDIARYGIEFDYRINDDLAYGEAKVRELLHYDPSKPIDSLNRPRLYISEHCPNTIQGLSLYTSKVRANSDGEVDDEKREETYKDFPDAVRYMAVSLVANAAPAAIWEDALADAYIDRTDLGISGYGE